MGSYKWDYKRCIGIMKGHIGIDRVEGSGRGDRP